MIYETPTPISAFPTRLNQRLDAIAYKTSVIRNLPTTELVSHELIDSEEFHKMFLDELEEEADELALDTRLYKRLGILAPDDDLTELLTDVLADVTLGFYEIDDNKIYIVADKDVFTLNDSLTAAHEATHALQQYSFNIDELIDSLEDHDDRAMALRSLIEGDASLSELLYMLTHFNADQQSEIQSGMSNADMSAFYAAPTFIQDTIIFPYTGGYQFAVYLYLKNNDFTAINLAYQTLPASTEQIMHPEKYDAGEEPIEVSIPDPTQLLGEGWIILDRNVMGELFLRSYLESDLDSETAARAAAGWGGDEFMLLKTPSGDDALVMFTVWDTEEDASEFLDAFIAYGEATSGQIWIELDASSGGLLETSDSGATRISGGGAEARMIVAPDSETANELFGALESLSPIPESDLENGIATSTNPVRN